MANSVESSIGAVCSGSTLFAFILNLSVMLGNYLQQTTSQMHFFLALKGLNQPFRSWYIGHNLCVQANIEGFGKTA